MVKHNFYKVSGLILSAALIIPLFASAQTDTGLSSQIQSLMSQITSLEQQLHTLIQTTVGSTTSGWGVPPNASSTPPKTGGPGSVPCPMIARDLSIGAQGSDVSELQQMLEGQGFLSASSTGFFGALTATALARYQKEMGLGTSTGFFGPLTRNFLNGHCGGYGDGGHNGTTTPPTWPGPHGTSTPGTWGNGEGSATSSRPGDGWHNWPVNPPATTTTGGPCLQAYSPSSDSAGSEAAGTNIQIMRPCGGVNPPLPGRFWNSSSTSQTPCPRATIQNGADVAAVAAALFIPHAILPGSDASPCPNGAATGGSSAGGQGGFGK